MKQRVTIDDVAQKVGVSRQTVSRAVNGQEGISAKTRDKVIKVVNELGYRPNRIAQGMAGGRTRTAGVLVSDLTNQASVESLRGILDYAEQQDYNIFVRHSNLQPDKEIEALQEFAAAGVDTILALSNLINEKGLIAFADTFWPIVLIHTHVKHPHISYVSSDVKRASKTVVEYLFGSGHHHVGLITRLGCIENVSHVHGYNRAHELHQLPINKKYIVQEKPTLEGGRQATLKLFADAPEITAVFAYNDTMAIGAMRACHELGKAIPQDCAIFGFNDIQMASYISPSLSTVRYNDYLLGKNAMELAMNQLNNPEKSISHSLVDVELVIRESTTLD